jgi:glutaminyl-peptide cyclotransferase
MRRHLAWACVIGIGVSSGLHVTAQQAPGEGAPAFDAARAWTHLEQLVAIGPRPAGSAGIRQARAYIGRQLSAMGLTVQEQPFVADTPVGRIEMANLIVRLPGRRTDRILFTGHYDTKLLEGRVFVGANDGGSSAAFLLELTRVLAGRTTRELTYEIVWLDGEEAFCDGWYDCGRPGSPDNTYGSRFYVQSAQKAGAVASMRAMVLVDMIADRDLRIRRDTLSTPWLNEILWRTARDLGHGGVFIDAETTVEDDHIPFLDAGISSVDIIDLDYSAWHTPDDTLDQVSARGLQIVGDVVIAALPAIERRAVR